MSVEQRVCAWDECAIEFVPSTHNMIYHTEECCKRATNARIMKKYHERKARRGGAKRVCRTPTCGAILSRYNDSTFCAPCQTREERDRSNSILEVLGI